MNTVKTSELRPTGVRFTETHVYVMLSDDREIGMPLSDRYLRWLRDATPEQRARWTITAAGDVYWPELDDGLEVEHLLKPEPVT
jgi:hypothetical protein